MRAELQKQPSHLGLNYGLGFGAVISRRAFCMHLYFYSHAPILGCCSSYLSSNLNQMADVATTLTYQNLLFVGRCKLPHQGLESEPNQNRVVYFKVFLRLIVSGTAGCSPRSASGPCPGKQRLEGLGVGDWAAKRCAVGIPKSFNLSCC